VSPESLWLMFVMLNVVAFGQATDETSPADSLQAAIPEIVFSNTNHSDAQRNPVIDVRFVTAQSVLLTRLETYHAPNETSPIDSTISLRNAEGTSIGVWPATGVVLPQGKPPSIRSIEPGIVLPPGEYVVEDSCRETWSWNDQSAGGMVRIWGIRQSDREEQQPPAEGLQRLILNGLQLDVQLAWKPIAGPGSAIHHLEMGSGGNRSATIEVLRRSGFDDLLAWLTAERGAELTGLSEQIVGGRSATEYEFSDPQKGTQGILLALSLPLSDGTYAAVVCEAPVNTWARVVELLPTIKQYVRVAPVDNDDSISAGDGSGTIPESTASEPEATWTPPPLTWDGPERWYEQPAGYFRIRLPDDWFVEEGVRNLAADPDFDSLKDPTGEFVLICSRTGNSCSIADRILTRFAGLKLGLEHCDQSHVGFLTLGDAPAVRMHYMTRQDPRKAISRMGFVYKNQFFVINTVAPAEAGLSPLPSNLQELVDTMEFIPDASPDSFYGPMGQELLDYKTLSGLTEDFGITVYEQGAVVHDMVQHLDTPFPIDKPGHPVMAGCEAFLNSDPEKREQMGEAITGEIIISDYRLCLQLFEGGFLIQDPLQRRVLQGVHKRRDR
jgi:hypothetical protein